jgi:PAS domain S-box-containing protein
MKYLNKLSIKTKLIVIILAVTIFSTSLFFVFGFFYDINKIKNDLKNNAILTAMVISENCKSPLLFSDQTGAYELLKSLGSVPSVIAAVLYTRENEILTSYYKSNDTIEFKSTLCEDLCVDFKDNKLLIVKKIKQSNETFGTLLLCYSTEEINKKTLLTLVIYLVMFILTSLLSYYIALKLQKIISAPIMRLKNITEKITHDSDYTIRINQDRGDEIGLLQKSTDMMVQQLHGLITSLKNEIVERKSSQEEAMRLRKFLRNIIDAMPSILIAVDSNGNVKQWNQEAVRFTGISSNNAYLKPLTEVFPLLKDKLAIIQQSIEEAKTLVFTEVVNASGDFEQRNFSIHIYPLTEQGNSGAVIRADDVTEKSRMEKIIIQNEKMMSVGGLAAGMAHEINNPLGIILQGAQNALRNFSPEIAKNISVAEECGTTLDTVKLYCEKRKINHYLDGIISAAKRAGDIVANMLHFSRKSSTSKSLSDIPDLVNKTMDLVYTDYDLKKKYDFRHIEIYKEFQDDIPGIYCNYTEIQQVVLNIVKNAAHALSGKRFIDEEPKVIIRIKKDDFFVLIEIEDNGTGIPEKYQNRIFEPFFTTKEVGTGTGLGLSVSYFIITKNHNGQINFETGPSGTRFYIRLPIQKASE